MYDVYTFNNMKEYCSNLQLNLDVTELNAVFLKPLVISLSESIRVRSKF